MTLNADGANNDIIFQSNGTTKATLDQDGVLAAGGGSLTGSLIVTNNVSAPLRLTNTTQAVDGTLVGIDFRMNHSGGSTVVAGLIGAEADGTWSSTSGTRDGAIVIKPAIDGNATERVRVDQHGLKFNGDTASANALDDYEEGTWTPTITSTVAGINYAESVQQGKYTKIGRLVNASFLIVVTGVTNSGGNGNKKIDGLPFTQDGSSYAQVGILGYNDVFDSDVGSFYATGSDLQFIPAGVTQSNTTEVITTGYLSGTITYIVS